MLKTGIYLIIGYLLGVLATDHMYMDLAQTDWGNILTYLWLLVWPIMVFVTFTVAFLVIGAIGFAVWFVYDRYS